MISLSDKIYAGFLGGFLGDALGMPVEKLTPEEIQEKFGFLQTFEKSGRNNWTDKPPGTYTDDTQLTLAVARGITEGGLDLPTQVRCHIHAYKTSQEGWGRTTLNALHRLEQGENPEATGTFENPKLGKGNGVLMKLFPVSAYLFAQKEDAITPWVFLKSFTQMTHNTNEALGGVLAYHTAICYCLKSHPGTFSLPELQAYIKLHLGNNFPEVSPWIQNAFDLENLPEIGGSGRERFSTHCSLAVVFRCLAQGQAQLEALYLAVNAGGDTDTNASMVGVLLGALHGPSIFPQPLLDGANPVQLEEVKDVAQQFIRSLP